MPSVDVFTCWGFNVTGFPTIVLVGVPSSTVLISIVTGELSGSLLAKNRSNAVKYAPFASSFGAFPFKLSIFPPTLNDCARGST